MRRDGRIMPISFHEQLSILKVASPATTRFSLPALTTSILKVKINSINNETKFEKKNYAKKTVHH